RAVAQLQPEVPSALAPALSLRGAADRPAARRPCVSARRAAARAAGAVGTAGTRVTLGPYERRLDGGQQRSAGAGLAGAVSGYGPAGDTHARPPVGDRAGDGAPRLRLFPRGPQAHRPLAGPLR